MYRVAFNTAITNIRKSKLHPIIEALSRSELNISEKVDVDYLNDDINHLYKANARLKDVEKAIIMLYLEERNYKEIGEIIGISEKNVVNQTSVCFRYQKKMASPSHQPADRSRVLQFPGLVPARTHACGYC